MMRALTKSDLENVSKLLANRHKKERVVFPALNDKFECPKAIESIVEKTFDDKHMVSVAAFDGERMLGFIMSTIKTDSVFGRCAWVNYDGMALADGVGEDLYRSLYAEISKEWIGLGCLKHFVIVGSGQEKLVNSWLQSGFAYEQVFGLQTLNVSKDEAQHKVTIKKALEKDEEVLASLSDIILSFQAQSPTYAVALPELFAEIRKGYAGLSSDEDAHVLLAYSGDKVLGFTCGYFDEDQGQNMMIPQNAFELGVAATTPEAQASGVGTILTKRLFADGIEAGFTHTITDWRITNLRSSYFWPKMGYKPYAYRLVRHIDERILWADGHKRL